jgi:hypothetical protein
MLKKKIQRWATPISESLRNYFFSGAGIGASAGFSGAGACSGAGAGAGVSTAGFSGVGGGVSAFLQPTLREKDTSNISAKSITKNFFMNCHLLSANFHES